MSENADRFNGRLPTIGGPGMIGAMCKIKDHFQITNRGVVVVVDRTIDLPVGQRLSATIHRPDGSTQVFDAWKEWLLKSSAQRNEQEAFLLNGGTKTAAPIGATISITTKQI